jgi:hypothetical protein
VKADESMSKLTASYARVIRIIPFYQDGLAKAQAGMLCTSGGMYVCSDFNERNGS